MIKKIKKNILVFSGFAALIYLALVVYADFDSVIQALQNFPISKLLIVFSLVVSSIIFKFLRWQYYLKCADLDIKLKNSILIFLSGLIMSISPGKIGELIKSLLLKTKNNIKISKSAPIILAERITEFMALIIICLIGGIYHNFGMEFIFFPIILSFVFYFLLRDDKILSFLIKYFSKFSAFKKNVHDVQVFRDSLNNLFKPYIFINSLFLSIFAWISECLSFYIVVNHFEEGLSVISSAFNYCVAIIIGAISMLPGGLAATEGTLSYLLIENGLMQNTAVTSTIIIRIATLWLSVLIGFIALIIYLNQNKSEYQKAVNLH